MLLSNTYYLPLRRGILVLCSWLYLLSVGLGGQSAWIPQRLLKGREASIPHSLTKSLELPVSSPSQQVAIHVRAGWALIIAQWDYEAARHFAHAIKDDEDCLLAYAGLSMALNTPNGEDVAFQRAAMARILDLIDGDDVAEKAGKTARFASWEKRFSLGIVALLSGESHQGKAMLSSLAKSYPDILLFHLLELSFNRGGYDILGLPDVDRRQTVERAQDLVLSTGKNALAIAFWLGLNSDATGRMLNLKKDVLPYARYWTEQLPDFPQAYYVLGHYEFLVGNYAFGIRAFSKSIALWKAWQKKEQIALSDCPQALWAEAYIVNALYQKGEWTKALQLAQNLHKLPLPEQRANALGTKALLWKIYPLVYHLYIARGQKGDAQKALQSLPSKEILQRCIKSSHPPSLIGEYIEALALGAGIQKALEEGDIAAAKALRDGLFRQKIVHLASFSQVAPLTPEGLDYFDAGSALAVEDMILAYKIAKAEYPNNPLFGVNWLLSACSKQARPLGMMPPMRCGLPYNLLGDAYYGAGKYQKAYAQYAEGLQFYPDNMDSLKGLHQCLSKLGKKKTASQVAKRIQAIKHMPIDE